MAHAVGVVKDMYFSGEAYSFYFFSINMFINYIFVLQRLHPISYMNMFLRTVEWLENGLDHISKIDDPMFSLSHIPISLMRLLILFIEEFATWGGLVALMKRDVVRMPQLLVAISILSSNILIGLVESANEFRQASITNIFCFIDGDREAHDHIHPLRPFGPEALVTKQALK
ncbi:hypothetical protein ACJX0J_024919 [Zea mays]